MIQVLTCPLIDVVLGHRLELLRDVHLEPERAEPFHVLANAVEVRKGRLDVELEADAVERDSAAEEVLGEGVDAVALGGVERPGCALPLVIVDEELDAGGRLAGRLLRGAR